MEFYEESQKEIIRDAITNAFLRYEQTHGESISYQQFDAEMLFALHLFNAPEYGNCYLYLSWDEACVMIDDAVHHKSKFSSYPYSKHLPKDADEFYFKSKAEFVNSMENLYYMLSSTKRKPETLKRIAENVLVSYRLTDRDFNILMAEFTFNESGHYDYRSLLPEGFDDKALSTLMDEKQKKVQYYKDSFFYLDITLEQRWDIRYSIGSKISKLLRPKSECFSLDEFKNIIWDGVFNPDNNENSGPLTWTEIKVMIADAFFNSDLTEGQVDYDMTYPPEEGNKFLLSIASEDLQSMCDLYEKLKTWGNGEKLSTEELKKRATDTSLSTADQLTKTDINSLIFQLGKPGRPFEYKDFLPKEADIAFFKDLLQAKDKPTVQPPAGQQVQTPDIIYNWDEQDGRLTAVATGKGKIKISIDSKQREDKDFVYISITSKPGNKHKITAFYTKSPGVKAENEVVIPTKQKQSYKKNPPEITPNYKDGTLAVSAHADLGVWLMVINKKDPDDYQVAIGEHKAALTFSYNDRIFNSFEAKAYVLEQGAQCSDFARKSITINAKETTFKKEPPKIKWEEKNGKMTVSANSGADKNLFVWIKVKLNGAEFRDNEKVLKQKVSLNIPYNQHIKNTFEATARFLDKSHKPVSNDACETRVIEAKEQKPTYDKKAPIIEKADAKDGVLTVTATGDYGVYLKVNNKKDKKDLKEDEKSGKVTVQLSYDPTVNNTFEITTYSTEQGKRVSQYVNQEIPVAASIPEPPVELPDKPLIEEDHKNGEVTVTATGKGIVRLKIGNKIEEGKGTAIQNVSYNPKKGITITAEAWIMLEGQPVSPATKVFQIDAKTSEPPAVTTPDKPLIDGVPENGKLTVTAKGNGIVRLVVGNKKKSKKDEVFLNIDYDEKVDNTFTAEADIMYKGKSVGHADKIFTIAAIIPDKPDIKEDHRAFGGTGVLTVTAKGEGQVKLEVGELVDQKKNEVSLSIPYEPFVDNNFKAVASIMYKEKALCTEEKDITIAAIIPDKPVIKETYENGVLTVTATGKGQVKLEVGEFVDQKENEVSLSIPYEPFVDNNFKAVADIMYKGKSLCHDEKKIKIAAIIPDKPLIDETHEDGVLTVTASGEGEVKLEIGNQSNQHKDSASLKISYEVRKSNTFMARAFIMHNGKPLCMAEKEIFIETVLPDPPEITWNASNGVLTVIATGEGIVRLDVDNLQYEEKDRAYLFFAYKTDRENVFHAQACIIENGSRMSHYAQTVITIPAQEQKPGGNNGNTTGDGGSGDDGSNGGGSGSGGTNDGGNKLASLDFRYIIGGPLKACVEAQEESARATTNYMTSAMLEKDENDIADYKPVMMYFYFIKDGSYNELSIPLMSILPIPYMNINHVDLNFQAQVTFSDKGQTNDKYELKACYPTYTAEDKRDTTTLTETTSRQNINIKLRASSIDQPAGISRLIQILDQEMSEIAPVTTRTVIEALPGNSFGVLLMSAGAHPVPVIEKLRELLNIGLPDAKALVDRAPVTIKDGITEDSAEAIKASLVALGAEVELVGKELITGGEPGGNGEVPGGNGEVPGGNGEEPDGNGEVPEGNGEVSGGNGEESGGNKGETGDNLVDPHYNDAVIIFDVVLKKPGTKKTQVIKKVKELLSIGLKDAKELVNKAPSTIMTGATKDAAEALKAALVALGAEVELIGHKPTTDEPQPSIDDLQPPVDDLQPPVDEPQPPVNDDGNANDDNTKYDVVLKSSGAKKLEVIKIIKERLKVGLKDAKDWVDHAPHTIMTGAAKGVAEALKAELVALGAEVELKGQKPTAEDNTATAFDVILKTSGIQKLEVIKKVKEQLKIGLKDAKELMDRLPYAIATGVAKDVAEALKAELVALGAEVELIGQKPTAQEGPSGNGNSTKTIVDIFIKSPGAQKLAVIKKIKESLTIGLKDAKDRVDNAPATIMTGVARDVAEALKAELVALGADVELR